MNNSKKNKKNAPPPKRYPQKQTTPAYKLPQTTTRKPTATKNLKQE